MTEAHQIATRAIGGTVSTAIIRDPTDGSARFSVIYQSRASFWQSRHRFHAEDQAQAAAITLGEFLGAEFRG